MGLQRLVASKVSKATVASVQPVFLFKPVGMARKEMNNAFLSMSSLKLLSCHETSKARHETVVELERWIAAFVIIASASDHASSTHSRHLKNSPVS